MNQVWVPLLAALLGGVIASVSSIASIFVQARFQGGRERARLAVEASIEEFKQAVEIAKRVSGGASVAPFSLFLYSNAKLLELVEEAQLTPEILAGLAKDLQKARELREKPLRK